MAMDLVAMEAGQEAEEVVEQHALSVGEALVASSAVENVAQPAELMATEAVGVPSALLLVRQQPDLSSSYHGQPQFCMHSDPLAPLGTLSLLSCSAILSRGDCVSMHKSTDICADTVNAHCFSKRAASLACRLLSFLLR